MHVLGETSGGIPRPRPFVLPLIESRRESPTVQTFRFSTDGTGFEYRSTQAVRVALRGVEDPWGAVRTFSLSSSPSETGELAFTCKISDTPFKQALARMRPGDVADVYGPLGMFLFDPARPAVFLAGGIGITPFRGMLRYAADTGNAVDKRLLYSARVPEELVFSKELDELARRDPHLTVHATVTRPADSASGWTGRTGRIGPEWIAEVARTLDRPKYYVAGLPEMVGTVVPWLAGPLGIPEDDIDYEVFRGF